MLTRSQIDQLLAQCLRDRATLKAERANLDKIEAQNEAFITSLQAQLAFIDEQATKESSHKRRVNATVNGMHAEHRLAISKSAKDDKFTKALRAAKFTQGSLAAAIGVRASMLSMYRTGDRKIPLSRAKRIEELTGWPADAKHWSCGIISDA